MPSHRGLSRIATGERPISSPTHWHFRGVFAKRYPDSPAATEGKGRISQRHGRSCAPMQTVVRRPVSCPASSEDGLAPFTAGQSVPPFVPSVLGVAQLFAFRPAPVELSRFVVPCSPRESSSGPGMKGRKFRPELVRAAPEKGVAAPLASLQPAQNQASIRLEMAMGSPRMESSSGDRRRPIRAAYSR